MASWAKVCDGSPPHAWGLSLCSSSRGSSHRFTPTCVGTMQGRIVPYPAYPVHPHMRGDYPNWALSQASPVGSPPHAWGLCLPRRVRVDVSRFTPTCVGTMGWPIGHPLRWPVHPHMRGDYGGRLSNLLPVSGSPPHAWGLWVPAGLTLFAHRFTPTCVGTIR